jgi:hypothetical protein
MLNKNKNTLSPMKAVLVLVILLIASGSADAQVWSGISQPLGLLSTRMPSMGNQVAQQADSWLSWPASLFNFAPSFRGELRAAVMLVSLEQGKFSNSSSGVSLDFIKDLGFEKQGVLIESTARTQLKRFALRAHYDIYQKNLTGKNGNLQWPEWRVGGDFDIMDSEGLRFGVSMDALLKEPTFSYSLPTGVSDFIVWPRPITVGAYAGYNPSDCESLSPSVEIRYRHPAVSGSLVQELEIAAGLKTPRGAKGTSALRAGWRYTSLEYDVAARRIDVTWSAFFVEYACFY